MKHTLAIVVFLVTALWVGSALAGGFHPSRVKLLIHGEQELEEGRTALLYNFIPSPNLKTGFHPLAYVSLQAKPFKWLSLEPTLGFNFSAEEPIFSMHVALQTEKFWSWTDLEYRIPSKAGYCFSQVEMKVSDWFHTGFEAEGWGVFKDASSWSYGGGPNMLLRMGKIGVDFALHARHLDDRTAPEFYLRTHLFL